MENSQKMRYQITSELKEIIKNSGFSLNKLSKICKFKVKNIYNINKSINENHLNILAKILKFDKEKLGLKEIEFDYAKNFGKYSYSKPIKFNGVSKEFAECIGIILGDGSISRNRLEIVIDKRDVKLRTHIKNLFNQSFPINLHEYESKNSNAVKLYYYNKNLFNLVMRFGLKNGDKIKNQIKIPYWIKENKEFMIACLRGLMITDGCVYYSKRDKQIYAKFTNHCFNLLNDFQEIAKILGFDFVKANQYNKALYKKDQVARFINALNLSDLKQVGDMV